MELAGQLLVTRSAAMPRHSVLINEISDGRSLDQSMLHFEYFCIHTECQSGTLFYQLSQ